jgi:hypothetical protein
MRNAGADRHAPRRGGRSFDVREVDFDVRPAGLGKCGHDRQATYGETRGIDDIGVRRCGAFVNEFQDGALEVGRERRHINADRRAKEEARTLRPEDGSIWALLAQAYVLKWAQTTDQAQRTDAQKKIDAAIAQAKKRGATPVHLGTVRLQWLVNQTAQAPDDQVDGLKANLADEIDNATKATKDDGSWYSHQLRRDAAALKDMVDKLEKKKQSELHWPN